LLHSRISPRIQTDVTLSLLDLLAVAKRCGEGWSGAELSSLANEAAIAAVREDREEVRFKDFIAALNMFEETRKPSTTKKEPGVNWGSFFQKMAQDQEEFPHAEELD
jgi:ATP-dependent Zn protease